MSKKVELVAKDKTGAVIGKKEVDMPENLAEARKMLSDEVVFKHFIAGFTVASRALLYPKKAGSSQSKVRQAIYENLVKLGIDPKKASEAAGFVPEVAAKK